MQGTNQGYAPVPGGMPPLGSGPGGVPSSQYLGGAPAYPPQQPFPGFQVGATLAPGGPPPPLPGTQMYTGAGAYPPQPNPLMPQGLQGYPPASAGGFAPPAPFAPYPGSAPAQYPGSAPAQYPGPAPAQYPFQQQGYLGQLAPAFGQPPPPAGYPGPLGQPSALGQALGAMSGLRGAGTMPPMPQQQGQPVPPPPGETGEAPLSVDQVPGETDEERAAREARELEEFEASAARAGALGGAKLDKKAQKIQNSSMASRPPQVVSAPAGRPHLASREADELVFAAPPGGPTAQREAARKTGRFKMEAYGLYIDRKPASKDAHVDRMERRLEHHRGGYLLGHVKSPADRMVGIGRVLGPAAAEDALLQAGEGAPPAPGSADVEAGAQAVSETAEEKMARRVEGRDGHPLEPFDENGVMVQEACPLKKVGGKMLVALQKQGDPLAAHRQVANAGPAYMTNAIAQFTSYHLEVEIGRVELHAHPAMAREDWLCAHLVALHRDAKLRDSVGLERYYWEKLMALEEDLLAARRDLFDLASTALPSTAERLVSRVKELEAGVAETRRVLQGEAVHRERTCAAMEAIYAEVEKERQMQGHSLTALALQVVAAPPLEKDEHEQQRRTTLDIRMAEAEMDEIVGLDRAPKRFTLPPSPTGMSKFKLRRTESLLAAFVHRRKGLEKELERLQKIVDGGSAPDERDREELLRIRRELEELGSRPRRANRHPEAQSRALQKAAEKVHRDGPFRVYHPKRLEARLYHKNEPSPNHATRAAQMARSKVQVRLMSGIHPVAVTEPVELGADFSADFKERLGLVVYRWPEDMRVQVLLRGKVVGEARVFVPGAGSTPPADPFPVPYWFNGLRAFKVKWPAHLPQAAERDASKVLLDARLGTDTAGSLRGGSATTVGRGELSHAGCCYVRCQWVPQQAAGEQEQAALDSSLERSRADDEAQLSLIDGTVRLMPPAPPPAVAESRTAYFGQVRVMRWLASSGLDPNDPRNADLLELKKHSDMSLQRGGGQIEALLPTEVGSLRLESVPEIRVGRTTVFASRRAKMLKLRWESESQSGKSMGIAIPISEAQIQELDTHKLLKRSGIPERDLRVRMEEEDLAEKELMMRRAHDAPSLGIIQDRARLLEEFSYDIRLAQAAGKKMLKGSAVETDDVVSQPRIDAKGLSVGDLIKDALRPRSKLRPAKKRPNVVAAGTTRDVSLVAMVSSVEALPMRVEGVRARGGADRAAGYVGVGDEATLLAPFVEILFGNHAARTKAQIGCFTSFNEAITLPVEGKQGQELSPRYLWALDDPVTINFFDEISVQTDGQVAGRDGADTSKYKPATGDPRITVTMERRFLGSLRIPFSSIFKARTLQGSVKIDVPPGMLGYVSHPSGAPTAQVYLTVTPQVPHPEPAVDELRAGESQDLQLRVTEWQQEVFQRTKGRNRASIMAVDKAGTSVLALRYVSPIAPPPRWLPGAAPAGLTGLRMLAWFVSHVPFLGDDNMEKDRDDVWCSASDFIRLGAGDEEEHACLLAGYFLHRGEEAFVVSGTSTTCASDYFVLTTGRGHDPSRYHVARGAARKPQDLKTGLADGGAVDTSRMRLWNATKGTSFDVLDPKCELRSVSVVFNSANAWANVQNGDHPWALSWNLDDPRLWVPLMGSAFEPRQLSSVQGEVVYQEHTPEFFEDLSRKLTEEVHDIIAQARLDLLNSNTWRQAQCSQILKRLLRDVHREVEKGFANIPNARPATAGLGPAPATDDDKMLGRFPRAVSEEIHRMHRAQLERELPAFDCQGVLLHLTFGDLENLAEIVLNTDLHMTMGGDVRFASSVHCHPLGTQFAFPVYVYLVAMRPKSTRALRM